MQFKGLRRITVVGLGLLGGSVALALAKSLPGRKVVGFAHRPQTLRKARQLGIAGEVSGDLGKSIRGAQLVILATPVCTFEGLFRDMADSLPDGCIVTDVGSTKLQVHRWASRYLPERVRFVGSHPMAGSEQQGVESSRADLFDRSVCFVTTAGRADPGAVRLVSDLWRYLGCRVERLTASRHDRLVAGISHVPQAVAVALVHATAAKDLPLAGRGFKDTTRIASSPANVWADIFLTNGPHVTRGIDRVISHLGQLRRAIDHQDRGRIERLLTGARVKRGRLMEAGIQRKGQLT